MVPNLELDWRGPGRASAGRSFVKLAEPARRGRVCRQMRALPRRKRRRPVRAGKGGVSAALGRGLVHLGRRHAQREDGGRLHQAEHAFRSGRPGAQEGAAERPGRLGCGGLHERAGASAGPAFHHTCHHFRQTDTMSQDNTRSYLILMLITDSRFEMNTCQQAFH